MKIAHVVNTMEVGGAEVLVADLSRTFLKLGHDVSVHCLSGEGTLGEHLRDKGIQVYSYPRTSALRRIPLLARVFQDIRPDAVHCHNVAPTVAGAPAARMARVKTVISTRHSLVAPPHDLRDELLYSAAARFCDHVVGICQATCQNLRTIPFVPKRKIICVYNGAVRPEVGPNALPPRTGFTLVHVSRLAPVKDQETLLRAFAMAQAKVHDLTLWVIGDGMMRSRLEQLACELQVSTHVFFFGEQRNVGTYLHAADAFVMSSISEGLPMALLEAMSMGLPMVVTDVGGMAEVVTLAACGAIAPRSTPELLAEKLRGLATDPVRAAEWGSRARLFYEKHFALERMAGNYLDIYRRH